MRTATQAVAWLDTFQQHPTFDVFEFCLGTVRAALDAPWAGPASYDVNTRGRDVRSAYGAWTETTKRHTDPADVAPAGAPVFFHPSRPGACGHVALSWGNGRIMSTDWPSAHEISLTTPGAITRVWGLPYLGWSEDLNGATISFDKPNPPSPHTSGNYTVHGGDTLWAIGQRFGCSVQWLYDHNPGLAGRPLILIGQRLTVPSHPVPHTAEYTIKSGDTLWAISQHHRCSVQWLYDHNPSLHGKSVIFPGQRIAVPA